MRITSTTGFRPKAERRGSVNVFLDEAEDYQRILHWIDIGDAITAVMTSDATMGSPHYEVFGKMDVCHKTINHSKQEIRIIGKITSWDGFFAQGTVVTASIRIGSLIGITKRQWTRDQIDAFNIPKSSLWIVLSKKHVKIMTYTSNGEINTRATIQRDESSATMQRLVEEIKEIQEAENYLGIDVIGTGPDTKSMVFFLKNHITNCHMIRWISVENLQKAIQLQNPKVFTPSLLSIMTSVFISFLSTVAGLNRPESQFAAVLCLVYAVLLLFVMLLDQSLTNWLNQPKEGWSTADEFIRFVRFTCYKPDVSVWVSWFVISVNVPSLATIFNNGLLATVFLYCQYSTIGILIYFMRKAYQEVNTTDE